MNIIACLIFWFLAYLAFPKRRNDRPKNYTQYPIRKAEVIGTGDYYGERWRVRFEDENGAMVIGVDDILASGTFHPEKYTLPKRGTVEDIYYWKLKEPYTHFINDKPVAYRFHFCNEAYYDLHWQQIKRDGKVFAVVAVCLFVIGLSILLFV